MKKDLVLSSVQNSVSSIFSKEDVINLIEKIEEEQVKSTLSITQLREITESILEAIEQEAQQGNIVCFDDVEFELDWNKKIEVTDVPINFDAIRDCIENTLTDAFEEREEVVGEEEMRDRFPANVEGSEEFNQANNEL